MGILQARILEWVAMLSSRGSSQPRDQTQVSGIAGDYLPAELPGKPADKINMKYIGTRIKEKLLFKWKIGGILKQLLFRFLRKHSLIHSVKIWTCILILFYFDICLVSVLF